MRIGVFDAMSTSRSIDELVEAVARAEADGFASYWAPQIFGFDAAMALAVAGREVPRIELGTGVIPVWQRHPQALAAQARTAQAATGGRFTLGIGLLHQPVVEGMFGMSFERPVGYMREYLSILLPLLREGSVSFAGDRLTFHGSVEVACEPVPVMVAALGTQMLRLTGREADGTVTWMTGPKTLAEHVVPTITKAADEAGRPAPRIVAALPTAVTDDADALRERAAAAFEIYGSLPSYRAMLDLEGAAGPADVAIIGDSASVTSRIRALFDCGITDFVAVGTGARKATREALRALL